MFRMTLADRLTRQTVFGNFAGALLTFVYFYVLDPSAHEGAPAAGRSAWIFFAVSFGLLFLVARTVGARWMRPVMELEGAPPPGPAGDGLRRRALLVPGIFASISLACWIAASLIWGVLWPLLVGDFTPVRALRQIFGIS